MIEILDPVSDAERVAELRAAGYEFVDAWTPARDELAGIAPFVGEMPTATSRLVAFPWRRAVVQLPDPDTFYRLRTARNRYLVDDDEQAAWAGALVGIAGLSVGASVLRVCALTGARRFRLAEFDTLGMTNLNRLEASVCDIGAPKLRSALRRVLEADPYTDVTAFPAGYRAADAAAFLGTGGEPLTVLLEEMDSLEHKIDIRVRARAARIPVLMVTDNGDNAILDVERFDLEPDRPLFAGRAGAVEALDPARLRNPAERLRIVSRIVGTDITPRARFSLTQVGRTLASWPQLGTAATAAGAFAGYAARLIACGKPLPSGRFRLDLDRAVYGGAATRAVDWHELDAAAFQAALA